MKLDIERISPAKSKFKQLSGPGGISQSGRNQRCLELGPAIGVGQIIARQFMQQITSTRGAAQLGGEHSCQTQVLHTGRIFGCQPFSQLVSVTESSQSSRNQRATPAILH